MALLSKANSSKLVIPAFTFSCCLRAFILFVCLLVSLLWIPDFYHSVQCYWNPEAYSQSFSLHSSSPTIHQQEFVCPLVLPFLHSIYAYRTTICDQQQLESISQDWHPFVLAYQQAVGLWNSDQPETNQPTPNLALTWCIMSILLAFTIVTIFFLCFLQGVAEDLLSLLPWGVILFQYLQVYVDNPPLFDYLAASFNVQTCSSLKTGYRAFNLPVIWINSQHELLAVTAWAAIYFMLSFVVIIFCQIAAIVSVFRVHLLLSENAETRKDKTAHDCVVSSHIASDKLVRGKMA